jgi:tetratricopeptide (TPR) repeat protein
MSIYYFRTLVIGSDPDNIHFYISRAFGEPGEDKETYVSWYKEVKALDNVCDLEIDSLMSISADLDEIIPMVDGIIYFINPTIQEELELFEMILPDIFSVKRDIPTIIFFYDQNGILPITVNDLLAHIWVNFPNLEAFVNLAPQNFHQILQCLCLAMINGDTPLNIENAWMRFPIFIQMANVYFNNKNYFYAAQAIRKAAQIADIYNKEEFFIISEQAAYLYSKLNLYLQASEMMGKFDKIKSRNFKKKYADQILVEGNRFFNKNEYEKAARHYEQAAQWSSIELLDTQFIYEAFRLAINSWISACRVEDAFRILQSLPHKDVIIILQEILEKIISEVEFLVSSNNLEQAKEQIYRAINRYQMEDLFDEIKELTNKLAEVLINLLKHQLKDKKKHAAKKSYDELENLWLGSYKVKKASIDSSLEELITLFFEDHNFEIASILIGKLESRKLRERLANIRDDYEDEFRASRRREVEDYINKGIQYIRDFAKAEQDIIIELNTQKISKANEFTKKGNFIDAANLLKKQADYLKTIGKDDIKDQILTKSMDILLDGLEFRTFFVFFEELSIDMKTKYLTRIFPKFNQKLIELRSTADYKNMNSIFEKTNRIYRDQMLYDQSKEITLLFIKVIKSEALRTLKEKDDLSVINEAEMLVKKVLNLASAYLEKEDTPKITFNKIYKKITEIYIKLDDLHLAHVYNDKIEKPTYKIELHKEIEMLEAKKSEIRSQKAIETRKGEELKEKDTIIEKRAQEARLDKEADIRERKGLKRGYFKEGLSYLDNQQYGEALILYKNTINRLNLTNKYKLAGVSLAIAGLILIKQNKFEDAKKLIDETKKKLSGLGKLFSEAFAVTLIEYVIDLKKSQNEEKYKKSIKYFEDLPLFDEELSLVKDLIGEEYKEEITTIEMGDKLISETQENKIILSREDFGEKSKIQIDLNQRYGKIQAKAGDAKRDQKQILKKRGPYIKRYYTSVIELLKLMNFKEAAEEYLKLGNKFFSKIKDFEISSLMMALNGLALLKAGEPLKVVKTNLGIYLNSLGVNKKLVKETFYIMLIMFLVDIKFYNFIDYLPKIKEMLEILPLFEEEKVLIDIQE